MSMRSTRENLNKLLTSKRNGAESEYEAITTTTE
ncbi:hypothetical protein AAZX31_02G185100 [Glycine max]